jgi:hypothetical protein
MSKTISIKSYSSTGAFVKIITDATFDSFKKMINGGLGDLTFKLARKIDNFNLNHDVSIGNKIEIWIYDEDTTIAGVLIYSGYVEQQNIRIDGGVEYVEIVCMGVVSKLTQDILKNVAQTTLCTIATTGLTVTLASLAAAEIADILKAMIDLFNVNNAVFPIYYNTSGVSSIETTGSMMKYKFEALYYLNAIEKCREVSPQNWYWYIGADNVLNFKAMASTADHTFSLSKHIKKITASKSADSVKNVLLLYDGVSKYKQYKDDVSITTYGRRVKQMTDLNLVADETTMDNIGAAFVNENKDPKIRIELEIIDNNESTFGYDIESIDPGETCKIVGVTPDENIFGENMVIQEVTWKLGIATVVVETEKLFGFDRLILDIEKKVNELDKTNVITPLPESYT